MNPRSCDALGVCQRRATPCDGCAHTARHDTQSLPPGGIWFAPGTIEAHKRERWSTLEICLAIIGVAGAVSAVVGLLRMVVGGAL